MNNNSNIHMDSKDDGGIHLWVIGTPRKILRDEESYSISVHLSKEEAIQLVERIMKRIYDYNMRQIRKLLRA